MDLPLSSSLDQYKVCHYSMRLTLEIDYQRLNGEVILHIQPVGGQQDGEHNVNIFELSLDCNDIEIEKIESVEEKEDSSLYFVSLLSHKLTSWVLTIRADVPGPPPTLIRVSYSTLPSSRSLLWRKDCTGELGVHTAAGAVNNRGLLPCQDLPRALTTWDLTLTIPTQRGKPLWVYCTGDTQGEVTTMSDTIRWKFSTERHLPISAFALAIGGWPPVSLGPGIRLAGPGSLVHKHSEKLGEFLSKTVNMATQLLRSTYPNVRTDLLIVHRSFSGLGLSSPNLIFLSPSLLAGDPALLIKLAHEVTHAWFGLHVFSLDWAETWVTEGFATFLEDMIFARVTREDKRLAGIRAMTRLLQLEEEIAGTSNEEQVMVSPSDSTGVSHRCLKMGIKDSSQVRRGLDPRAGLGQIHYIKGYFLLHFLMEACGGEEVFLKLVADYIKRYAGLSVTGAAFVELFVATFPNLSAEYKAIVNKWLGEPGLPNQLRSLNIIKQVSLSSLYREVVDHVAEVKHLNARKKIKSSELDFLHDPLTETAQITLLLTLLLQLPSIKHQILKLLKTRYQDNFDRNPELSHLWCELVVKHRLRSDYSSLSNLLIEHQAMGVYLYAEMGMAKNLCLNELAKDIFSRVKDELDRDAKEVVLSYIQKAS